MSLEYTRAPASVRLPTASNIFIFQTALPIKAKFCSQPSFVKKRKLLCGLMSHMTKIATKSIKGKTFRNRRTQCADSQETCSIGDSEPLFVEMFFHGYERNGCQLIRYLISSMIGEHGIKSYKHSICRFQDRNLVTKLLGKNNLTSIMPVHTVCTFRKPICMCMLVLIELDCFAMRHG